MANELQKISSFEYRLAVAETLDDLKKVESEGAGLAEFAKRENISLEGQNKLGRLRIKIEDEKGKWLDKYHPRGRPWNKNKASHGEALKMPVNLHESRRARLIANAEPEKIEEIATNIAKRKDVITPAKIEKELRKELKDKDIEEKEKQSESYKNNLVSKYIKQIYIEDVLTALKKIKSNSVDLCCIDPPYNMKKAEWDDIENYNDWSMKWLSECYRILKKSGSIYVFGNFNVLRETSLIMDNIGFDFQTYIVWDIMQGQGNALWINRHEDMLFYTKGNNYYKDANSIILYRHESNIRIDQGTELKFKNPSNVWRFPRVDPQHKDRTKHPTQKPVELIERMIKASCPVNGVVIDPFLGSGTTAIACLNTHRYCIGIENNETYIKIINKRIEEKLNE